VGKKSVDNPVFFARLGQRIIHLLETFTAAGSLYEVDMRLRPSGNSGMLVSSLEAFEHYQRNDAWVWEHQALVRARPVAGDPALGRRFDKIRAAVLAANSHLENLRSEVREMRERMRAELGSKGRVGFQQVIDAARGPVPAFLDCLRFSFHRRMMRFPLLLRVEQPIRIY